MGTEPSDILVDSAESIQPVIDKFVFLKRTKGQLRLNLGGPLSPSRPISALVIHGTEDPLVPASGREVRGGQDGKISSVNDTVQKWVQLDGCSPVPLLTYLPHTANHGTRVRNETNSDCRENSEVVLYIVEGGGHTWLGGVRYLPESLVGKTSHNSNEGIVIWEFFQAGPKR